MKLFRVYVDGALFYHPQMSKLAITQAKVQEDAENIDCLTLSAPLQPSLTSIRSSPYFFHHHLQEGRRGSVRGQGA